jgi:hypothetical protein
MGCNCGSSKYKLEEKITVSSGDKVLILYTHPNIGKKIVKSPTTFEKYGYYGGGSVFEVLKADIRLRPQWFGTCGNCRQPLTITKDDVFCPRCSQIQSANINRPSVQKVAEAVQSITPKPESIPDPKPIAKPSEEELQEMLRVTDSPGTMLEELDFGRSLNKRHLGLLKEKGITTLEKAIEVGPDKLQEIRGIGDGVVSAIMAKA